MISSCAIAIVLAVAGALLAPAAAQADPTPQPGIDLPMPDLLPSPTPEPTKTHKARKPKKQHPTPAPIATAPTSTAATAPTAQRAPNTLQQAPSSPQQEYALNPAARVTPPYRIPAPVLDISEAPAVDQSPTDTSLSIAIVALILAAIFGTWLIMLVLGRGRGSGSAGPAAPPVQYMPVYPPAPNINIDFKPSWTTGSAPRVIEGETHPTEKIEAEAFMLSAEDRLRQMGQGDG